MSALRRFLAPRRRAAATPPPGLTLVRIEGTRTVYQCIGSFRAQISSAELFRHLGFDRRWVQEISAGHPLAQLPVLRPSTVSSRGQGGASKRKPSPEPVFRTFEEYLNAAITNPNLIRTPYSEEDRRVLAYMEWRKDRLAAAHADQHEELVTVIIPTYQRAAVVRIAIASVLGQSHRNLEVIVVDDGSDDGTEAVVSAITDDRVRYIRLERNSGNAAARNAGLRAARGTWLAYLDSDDTWDEHFLRIMVGELTAAGAEFGYSAQRVVRPLPPGEAERQHIIRFAPFHRGLLENNNFISMISVLHRRSLIDEVGPFDEAFRRYVDWEFFLRLSAVSRPVAVPVVLSHYDQSDAALSVSRSEDRALHQELVRRQLRKGFELAPLLPELLPAAEVAGVLDVAFHAPARIEPAPAVPGVTVVIPSYEAAPYLRACVSSIEAFSPKGTHLVIVDNASGPDVQDHLAELEARDGITVIRNDVNYGFTYAVNQGIEAADPSHDVVLMNNDALVTPGWLEALQHVPSERDDVGIVAPRQVLPAGTATIRTHVPGADATRECDTNLSAHHRNVIDPFLDPSRGWVELSYAPFFCVLLTRQALERCGPLDHVHAPHYRSDRVYCDAVRSHAGLRIIYTPDSKVYHFHQRATDALRGADADLFAAMRTSSPWDHLVTIQRSARAGRARS